MNTCCANCPYLITFWQGAICNLGYTITVEVVRNAEVMYLSDNCDLRDAVFANWKFNYRKNVEEKA